MPPSNANPALSMPLPPPPPAPAAAPVAAAGPAPMRPSARPALRHVQGVAPGSRPWTLIFSLIAVFIAMVGTFILYFLNVSTKAQIDHTNTEIKELNDLMSKPPLSDTQAAFTALTGRLVTYKTDVAQQIDFSSLLNQIPAIIPKDMTLSAMAIDEKGVLHVNGKTKTFDSTGKALLAFRQAKYLSDVKLNSLNYSTDKDENTISFDISAALKKEGINPISTPPTGQTTPTQPGVTQ